MKLFREHRRDRETESGNGMRSRRPIAINNSLAHGICNYNCGLCSVNKPAYRGPRCYQSLDVTQQLAERVREAAKSGMHIRYIANAGDGEPTLHPQFTECMSVFGDMLRQWDAETPAPEVSVVTNGSRLQLPGVLDAIAGNDLSLIVSLPTTDPEAYGQIMFCDSQRGAKTLARVKRGIEAAAALAGEGKLNRLLFHISPPERDVIRRDFPKTVDFLTSTARNAGLDEVNLIMFPATSNRSGLIANRIGGTDMYRDLFRRFDGKNINGVTVRMELVLKRFLRDTGELIDLLRSFRFPCIWNANLFIAADGSSICCNDQAVRNPMGNVMEQSLAELMRTKEEFSPGKTCAGCDQRPEKLKGSPAACLFALGAKCRMALAGTKQQRPRIRTNAIVEAEKALGLGHQESAKEEKAPGNSSGTRITNVFRRIEADATRSQPYRFGADERYEIKVANTISDRVKAWSLAYQVYLGKEYASPDPKRLWYSLHDALPETTTFLAERDGRPVAALTLVFDSPVGMPADAVYSGELDGMRGNGRRLCEIVSLVSVAPSLREGAEITRHLFKLAYLTALKLQHATDFVITVNPRHAGFYKRVLLFDQVGQERMYDKVGGAPAVLLRLDLETACVRYQGKYGDSKTGLKHFFMDPQTEPGLLQLIRRSRKELRESALRRYFIEERPLLPEAPHAARRHIENCHPFYELSLEPCEAARMS